MKVLLLTEKVIGGDSVVGISIVNGDEPEIEEIRKLAPDLGIAVGLHPVDQLHSLACHVRDEASELAEELREEAV